MAKKGKEEAKGAKGKEAKKGKKEVATDSEDVSDAEVSKSNAEESEMGSEMVEEEEEEESEDDPKKKKGKDKKGAAKGGKKAAAKAGKKGASEDDEEEDVSGKKKRQIKGASKLVMGLATEDAKKKKGAKKEHAKAQLKGATKAMAMAKKEAAEPPKKVRSLKSTSKLFMGLKGVGQKKTPKKSQFKNTSRFFWGLKKHSTKRRKKKKNKGVLKSTSNLMMRFKELGKKKKKKKEEQASGAGGTKKPSFMLIRLGGGRAEGPRGKGGGFFGSLFQRRSKPNQNFKVRAQIVSKVAAATSWLTRKFLSKHCTCPYNSRVTDESWLSRIGAKKLPFPSGDEVLRHRANMRKIPGRETLYGQTQEDFGYWDKFDSATQLDRYNDYRESGYDPPPSSRYGYPEEVDHYSSRNPMDDAYGPAEEPVDYYDQDQYDYHNYDNHQECDSFASYSPYEPYDGLRNDREGCRGMRGPSDGEAEQVGYPGDDVYSQHEVSYSEHEWPSETQASYNPYAYPLGDIAEMDEREGAEGGTGGDPFPSPYSSLLERPCGVDDLLSKLPPNRKFRLFPRPQVKLFGKDKLDVTLPPSPHLPFGSWDPEEEEEVEEEEEEEAEPLISPFAQFDEQHLELPRSPGTFSTLLPSCFVSKLQRPRSTNLHGRNFGRGVGPSNPGISPREYGSPLGQFLQRSLSQPKPILKHRRGGGTSRPPSPAPMRRGPPSPFGERRPTRPSSPQLPAMGHFEMPSSGPSPKSVRRFGALPSSHPSARLRDALHEELHSTLPFLRSSSYKRAQQGPGVPVRKPSPTAAINKNSPQLSQRQSSPPRSFGSNRQSQPTARNPTESSSFRASSSPQPKARNSFASKRNPSSSSLGSIHSLKMDVPFSRSLFHVPHTPDPSEFQDFPLNGIPGRYTPTGFHNTTTGSLTAPSSPQISLGHFGSSPRPAPNPFRPSRRINHASVDPAGRLPQAWNRQNEPPTKAVKPLMRDQFMRQLIPQSPIISARDSPHMLSRQGSRRVTIQESPIDSSPYAQPFDEADGTAETLWWQQEEWDYPSGNGIMAPWDPSSRGGTPGSLRSVSNLPRRPPSPAPSTRKAFLQRIGQPLAGMAQPASPIDMEDGYPYRAQFGQSPGPSPVLSRHRFAQEPFAEVAASLAQMGEGGYSQSPSPNMGRQFSAGNLSYGGPGYLAGPDLSPMSQRAYLFKGPHARGRGNPSMARSSPFQDQYSRPMRPGPARFPDELQLEHEMEDSVGRYAVVTPQVQRRGSSFRRSTRRPNQPWSDYHTVNVHEMPDGRASEKLFQRPPTGSAKRRGSRRGGSSVFWYLTRGSLAHNQEYGGSNRNWQCKVIRRVSVQPWLVASTSAGGGEPVLGFSVNFEGTV